MQLNQYKKFFLTEAREKLKDLEDLLIQLENDLSNQDVLARMSVSVHTLKSDASTMSYMKLANALHQAEDLFIAFKQGRRVSKEDVDNLFILIDAFRSDLTSIEEKDVEIDLNPACAFILRLLSTTKDASGRSQAAKTSPSQQTETVYEPISTYVEVSAEQLDSILEKVNDLIAFNQHMQRLLKRSDTGGLAIGMNSMVSKLSSVRENVVSIKMMPVRQYFVFLSRLVRDLSRVGKKFVTLEFKDNNLRFERHILESLRDVCVQLIKNAVDHGYSEGQTGVVSIIFEVKSNRLLLTVSDKGLGIDWQDLEEKALSKKVISVDQLNSLGENERRLAILGAGISSQTAVTMSSGRGVGWQSVLRMVESLHGSVQVASETSGPHHGTSIQISIPLTPTMFRALTWRWGPYYLALPLFIVEKIVQLPSGKSMSSVKTYVYGTQRIPVFDLIAALGLKSESQAGIIPDAIALLRNEGKLIAVSLPAGVTEQEVIASSLPCLAKNPFVAGVAVSEYSVPLVILNHYHMFKVLHG